MKSRFLLILCLGFILFSAHAIDGDWKGLLQAGPASLPIVFHADDYTLDSPAQGASGIAGRKLFHAGDTISVQFPSLGARLYGRQIAPDTLRVTLEQRGHSFPIIMTRPEVPEESDTALMTTTDLRIGHLAGTLTMPVGFSDATPLAVLVTGSGPQTRDEIVAGHPLFELLARQLASDGIATFRYDDRGVGESTGDFSGATTSDFAADARMVVDSLRTRHKGRIGIIGHSEGGRIAFAPLNADFAVSLMGPALPGDSILIRQNIDILSSIPEMSEYLTLVPEVIEAAKEGREPVIPADIDPALLSRVEAMQTSLQTPWLLHFLRDDPSDDIRAISIPTLAIYGGKDLQVEAESNAAAMRRLNPHVTVLIIPDINHIFQQTTTGRVEDYWKDEPFSALLFEAIASFILH